MLRKLYVFTSAALALAAKVARAETIHWAAPHADVGVPTRARELLVTPVRADVPTHTIWA